MKGEDASCDEHLSFLHFVLALNQKGNTGQSHHTHSHSTECSDQYTLLAMTEVMEATIYFVQPRAATTVKLLCYEQWCMFPMALVHPQFGLVKL